ncbi:MAG: peptide chain release factor N(5)-glutamine methyltransferase [Acidobacteriota bacterium]
MATVRELLGEAVRRLAAAGRPQPRLDAEVLLAHVLGVGRVWLLAHANDSTDASRAESFRRLVETVATGRPLQHILGRQEFYGREFLVDDSVLIPRPETEFVVELALRLLSRGRVAVADVGTGSGCIGVTLACEHRQARVVGTDISRRALVVARRNACRWGVQERFLPVNTRTLAALPVRPCLDLVVSNPPYVAVGDPAVEPSVARFEPREAVYAGPTGLEIHREILTEAAPRLRPQGHLVLEIGRGQVPALEELASQLGWTVVEILSDYAGIPRVMALQSAAFRTPTTAADAPGPGAHRA